MKKVFVSLLTLAMCFCLLRINTNRVNAEENDTVTINYGLVITNGKIYRSDATTTEIDYQSLGITNNSQEGDERYTFTKNIVCTSSASLIEFNTSVLTFVINGNLTFKQSNATNPTFLKNPDITIQGNGNILKIESNFYAIAEGKYTLDNIKLVVEGNSENGAINQINKLYLVNGAGLKVGNSNPSGMALKYSIADISGINTQKGSLTYLATGNLVDVVLESGTYKDQTGGTAVKYLELNGWKDPEPTPAPTPDPSPKDESCEKVIGPSWHWNNDKGICEDYGVVGTATKMND